MSANRQLRKMEKISALAQELLASMRQSGSNGYSTSKPSGKAPKRKRRTAEEAKKMKAEVLSALKAGQPATKVAKRYGVTTAYVYMLKSAS